ncbi:MAG TPA: mechanosensitive ion channel domain-containing protein [Lacisediminihabitans sp.]|uniref:mechanosensitive ion channel family protein n=1 Tax=Lacisediminihabitans sp. TaxID=2787631 RepID=UPI002EDADB48
MFEWKSWFGLGVAVVIALVAATLVVIVTSLIFRAAARREEWARGLVSQARHPFRLLVYVVGVWIAGAFAFPAGTGLDGSVHHLFLIVTIAASTWFLVTFVSFSLGLATSRYRVDVADNKLARRAQTQILIVRRLAAVIIAIIGLAAILLTFPGVQAVGASVLASAGVVSIVAGLAAQSTLSNVFAGVQLAFSGAIRVDDVVIAEEEWGRIEEITLTYVVVHIWDDRRLVLPSTYFTTTPFENWTRHSSELLGSVDFDLDWRVSPSLMREKLEEILGRTPLWDKRASVLQVTDAVGGFVHVRILVTAVDAPTLFDLRCFVREEMVEWLHEKDPAAIPRTRIQTVEEQPRARRKASDQRADTGGLFTGNPEAEERASQFTAAVPIQRPEAQDAGEKD